RQADSVRSHSCKEGIKSVPDWKAVDLLLFQLRTRLLGGRRILETGETRAIDLAAFFGGRNFGLQTRRDLVDRRTIFRQQLLRTGKRRRRAELDRPGRCTRG